jgi:RNA polymerase sigma factor (sigma-70 family)
MANTKRRGESYLVSGPPIWISPQRGDDHSPHWGRRSPWKATKEATVQQGATTSLRARHATGHDGAIDDVYAALSPMVLGYLRRFVPHDEAEDVLQRVFYEVWRHKDRYDPSRSLRAWVLGIANKRAIDHVRRQRRTAVPVEELYGIAGEDGRELAERYARASEVRDALSRLPDEQREVLRLAYFGDCTQTQIAAQLGVPLGTVKARTFRGLRRLGQLLASDYQ